MIFWAFQQATEENFHISIPGTTAREDAVFFFNRMKSQEFCVFFKSVSISKSTCDQTRI